MFGLTCTINRYYDPSTDQFLSVDPDVQTTDQPYAFVNDDPLNVEDPLGQSGFIGGGPCQNESCPSLPSWLVLAAYSLPAVVLAGLTCFISCAEAVTAASGGVIIASEDGGDSVATDGDAVASSGMPDKITSWGSHVLEQIDERDGGVGVSKSALEDAVKNPLRVVPQPNHTFQFIGKDATAVLNSAGKVVTGWATNKSGYK